MRDCTVSLNLRKKTMKKFFKMDERTRLED